MDIKFNQLSESTLIFGKKHTQKSHKFSVATNFYC